MTGLVVIGIAGFCHLFLFCLLLPWAAVQSARRLATRPYPPRLKFFTAVMLQHLFFVGFSIAVAWVEEIPLTVRPKNLALSMIMAAFFLGAIVALMVPHWKQNVLSRERKVYLFMPRGATEKSLWVVISLAAGIGEEIIYRGVTWTLFTRLTGSIWLAALIASIVFAFSHYMQGWKSMLAIFGFALIFHLIVWLTGSLYPAMAVHFLYDLTAGMTYSYFGVKLGYPVEGISNGHLRVEEEKTEQTEKS
jgi:membrane protease YdiL (CAAX protease family)